MRAISIYFSDFFNVSEEALADYGAFNVSLLVDLPLFIDPFLLFNSEQPKYKELHTRIINYLKFLRDTSQGSATPTGLLQARYCFKEVKQTWLGFSLNGNAGRGLGMKFARTLSVGLSQLFPATDENEEPISKAAHFEKLCLIAPGVGRDTISDFATNLIKEYLLEFTEKFAVTHIATDQRRRRAVEKVSFNFETGSWRIRSFDLPWDGTDYVILAPKDLLSQDETWINKDDFYREFSEIPTAMGNVELRAQVEQYFRSVLPKNPNDEDKKAAMSRTAAQFPALLDYFIRHKENNGDLAVANSSQKVAASIALYHNQFRQLAELLEASSSFFDLRPSTSEDARLRIEYLKDVIENKGGWRFFYHGGKKLPREKDLHILFKFVWRASVHDVSSEVDDGRGPVDSKITQGAKDKTIVEMKLASSSSLRNNLQFQGEIYKKASGAQTVYKVVIYFTLAEKKRVEDVLKELGHTESPYVILIDARDDNKPPGSKATSKNQ